MSITGVTESVKAAMEAVSADVLCEDDLMQRTCEHGIRHPVGHLKRELRLDDAEAKVVGDRHQRASAIAGMTTAARVTCDGCCSAWVTEGRRG